MAWGLAETKYTVLVVDDDQRLRHLVEVVLQNNGFKVEFAEDGDALLPMVRRHRPDVVLLDLKMARMSGLEALQGLRSAGEDLGVIILSAAGEEALVLAAFEAGADDYVTKPFMIRVLLARLRAVLKRSVRAPADAGTEGNGVTLEPRTHHASVEGRRVALSPKEYELLRTLIRGSGHVFTSDELLARVWGEAYVGQDEIVRANIYRLRQKLEPRPSKPRYIQGRRGVGYYLARAVAT
jgi:two-component system alkaline phosphatase synthesis response regulator PhoP